MKVEDLLDNESLPVVYLKIEYFVPAFVYPSFVNKLIAVWCYATLEATFFHDLPHTCFCTYGRFNAFSRRLPEPDIVQQLVNMVFEALLPFFDAPYFNALLREPFDHKRCLVIFASNAIKHKYKQYIEFSSKGCLLQILNGIAIFRGHLEP